MIKVIAFLLLVAALAAAGAWLAEQPGDVAITFMHWRIETSPLVGLGILVIFIVVVMALWSLLRFVWRSPRLLGHHRRERRRRRGDRAISQGLVAVASGDARSARRFASEAGRFAAHEPLTLLLTAQTAQLAGDRNGADQAFHAMAERPETRLLGLRGLYIEAQRRGDAAAARRLAEEAARSSPALAWAGQAVYEFRSASGDWGGALAALESNLRGGLIDRVIYRRQRAVLLTARALGVQDTDPQRAKGLAFEAAKLAPELIPAVVLAARLASHGGDLRRAAKLVEATWREHPHPELADVYSHLRPGDSARERLARMQTLARLRSAHPESALGLARAAIDAHEFAVARNALQPLLSQPTQRVALLMAELEETEHGDAGRVREWMSRAVRAAGDPRWIADGMVSDRWLPVSPLSGRVDAFEWKVPLTQLGYAGSEEERDTLAPPLGGPGASTLTDRRSSDTALPAPTAAEPPQQETTSASASASLPAETSETVSATPPPASTAAKPEAANPASAERLTGATRAGNIIPLMHAPDDPGPDHDIDPRLGGAERSSYPLR